MAMGRATFFGLRAAAMAAASLMVWAAPRAGAAIHGTVEFLSTPTFTASLANPVAVAAGDVDGDGWIDMVASANNTERIVWYRNAGNGTFVPAQYTVTTSPSTAAFTNVALADLNVDGRLDVVYWSGTSIKWSPNLGGSDPLAQFGYDAAAPTANQLAVATTNTPETQVATSDLNGDARPDVLSITLSESPVIDNSVAWVPNLVGGFGSRIVISTAGGYPSSVQGVDLDKDGWNDLLVTTESDNTVAWFRNLGGGNFGTAPGHRRVISNTVSLARAAAVGDLNGDGWPDVVTAGYGSGVIRWHAHNGSAASPAFGGPLTITQNVSVAWALAVRDMNSDGWPDVVVSPLGSGTSVFWCENLGGGNFGTPTTNQRAIASLNIPTSIEVVDYDQNGTFDLLANANSGAVVRAFRNQGGQTALATLDTAPATLIEGRRDDVLRVGVTHRGIAGDSAAQLGTLSLLFESGAGVPLSTAQANALLDKVAVHLDADSSGVFDPAVDPAVATVTDLTLTSGVLSFPFTGAVPANIQIAPGATRSFFIVVKMTANATGQAPSAVRVTHRSSGAGRSVFRDATTSAVLTSEIAGSANVTSSVVTAAPQGYTYTDWSYIHFDAAGVAGTLPLQSQAPDAIPNLLKYGLAIDPLASSAPLGLPVMLRQGSAKIFRHLRPSVINDLTYEYDISRTLGTWQPAVEGVDYTRQDTLLGNGWIQRDLTILGAWPKTFLRARLVLAN
jgi:hypothetical protein